MFSNIGEKIKGLAKALCVIGTAASAIIAAGMFLVAGDAWRYDRVSLITLGLITLMVGPLASWISSIMLYGFGELIDRASSIDNQLTMQNTLLSELQLSVSTETEPKQPGQPKQHPAPVNHSAASPQPILNKPSATEADTATSAAQQETYDDFELQVLKSLLEEGKLSEEEYQNCISGLKK